MSLPSESELLFDSNRGVYIPQHFAQEIRREMVSGVSADDFAVLESGPDHEWYWDTWNDVEQNAVLTKPDGSRWILYQDGDVWLVPEDAEWPDDC